MGVRPLIKRQRQGIVQYRGDPLAHSIQASAVGMPFQRFDAARNRVVVGDSALDRDEFQAERCNWIPFERCRPTVGVTVCIIIRELVTNPERPKRRRCSR